MNDKENTQNHKAKSLSPDINEASRFLSFLARDLENEKFAFQIFSDEKEEKPENGQENKEDKIEKPKFIPEVLIGSFEGLKEKLKEKNEAGYGIFVTVNSTDGKGRKTENIIGVRALFVDLDGSSLEPVLQGPLKPHMTIESSPGRYHAYWKVKGIECDEFKEIQQILLSRFEGDPKVCDLPRVMRIPGFYHLKKSPFQSKILHIEEKLPYERDEFLNAFEIIINPESPAKGKEKFISNDPVVNELNRQGLIIKKENYPNPTLPLVVT